MKKNALNKVSFSLLAGAFLKFHGVLICLVYLVMFGSVNGNVILSFHGQLIKAILSNYTLLLCTTLFWFFYACHVILFLKDKINNTQNYCLLLLNCLPQKNLQGLLFYNIFLCLLPVSSYGLATIIYGFANGFNMQAIALLLFFMAIHIFGIYAINFFLKNTQLNFRLFKIYQPLKLKIYWPAILYLKYILNQQLLAFLLIKFTTIFTIIMVFFSRRPTDEMRLPIVLYALALIINTSLITKLILWHETQFTHHRVLPIPLYKRLINILFFCVLILIPEHIFIFKTVPLHASLSTSLALICLGISFIFCIFGISYASKAVLNNTYPYVGLCMLVIYFGALADNIWLINAVLFAIAVILLVTQYPIFEAQPQLVETT